MSDKQDQEIIVIKAGSNVLVGPEGIDQQKIDHYAELWEPYHDRYQMVIVSSGAVALGATIWRQARPLETTETKQTLAMLGSAGVVNAWEAAFKPHSILVSQLLATHRDVADRSPDNTLEKTLRENMRHGIIPIVNENDALNTEELEEEEYGGGNDGLATDFAIRLGARALFLLTNERGVLSGRSVWDLKVIHRIASDRARQRALKYTNLLDPAGMGGMGAKLENAYKAADAGIDTYIGPPTVPLERFTKDKAGTHIFARTPAA